MEESLNIPRNLFDFSFDDDALDEIGTCHATLQMFYALELHSRFSIEKEVS